ncbi:MAG: hypothetical protein P4L87_20025 [Formivibrio sp.]|nr:hypothetical protein [Formivibrio sp.]
MSLQDQKQVEVLEFVTPAKTANGNAGPKGSALSGKIAGFRAAPE